MAYAQCHGAFHIERLVENGGFFLFYDFHDFVEEGVFEVDDKHLVYGLFDDLIVCDGVASTLFIGVDETARPQFGASEVTNDDKQCVCQVVGLQYAEHGAAGCSGGFSVVVGPELFPFGT